MSFHFDDFQPHADGVQDDTPALTACFEAVSRAGGGVVVIPPGSYHLAAASPIPIPSGASVTAYGARFLLPKQLGDGARLVVFEGRDVVDFAWSGGHFQGECFDPRRQANTWAPNANTRVFVIGASAGGTTGRLTFRDIGSDHVAGSVVHVAGLTKAGSDSEVERFAAHVTVENCVLLDSGKFMWDYGYLWQILVWPEDHTRTEAALAEQYFPAELIHGVARMADGDDRVVLDAGAGQVPVSETDHPREAVCFFGDRLPANIVRGRKYYVVESNPGQIKVAEQFGGSPICFEGSAGPNARLMHNLFEAHLALYSPVGAGPGKGGVDLVGCRNVRVSGCQLSALGDTMHIQRSENIVFADNQIAGSRMGAFFLAEYCRNASVVGNIVDGTNGSRVMSVEKSSRDVTIVGNTFRNGGRGSWINQPTNFILQGNVFVNNTTKCERDPRRGRRSFETGGYETYPELYFTLHEKDGRYGGVIVRDNIFETGPECRDTIAFAKNGSQLLVAGNIFKGARRSVRVDPNCTEVMIRDNLGLPEEAK